MGNGQSSSNSQPVDGRAGYVDPEEQARRDRQDKQFGEAMNSNGVRVYQQRAAEDAKVNAAAAGGGFNMDIDAMKALQPRWQGIADKLSDMMQLGDQFKGFRSPRRIRPARCRRRPPTVTPTLTWQASSNNGPMPRATRIS